MNKAAWLRERPIAHRGLHDRTKNIAENTLSAARAAADAGYAIEMDLQYSRDGVAMVFHDHELDRLTGCSGSIRKSSSSLLRRLSIAGTADLMPTLDDLLITVAGRTGLLLELKGCEGDDAGFAEAVARSLAAYAGPVALMSFDTCLVADLRRLRLDIPIGLTAEGGAEHEGVHGDAVSRHEVDFVSYNAADLPCRFFSEFRSSARPAIVWTIRSPQEEARARQYADQITFEGYRP